MSKDAEGNEINLKELQDQAQDTKMPVNIQARKELAGTLHNSIRNVRKVAERGLQSRDRHTLDNISGRYNLLEQKTVDTSTVANYILEQRAALSTLLGILKTLPEKQPTVTQPSTTATAPQSRTQATRSSTPVPTPRTGPVPRSSTPAPTPRTEAAPQETRQPPSAEATAQRNQRLIADLQEHVSKLDFKNLTSQQKLDTLGRIKVAFEANRIQPDRQLPQNRWVDTSEVLLGENVKRFFQVAYPNQVTKMDNTKVVKSQYDSFITTINTFIAQEQKAITNPTVDLTPPLTERTDSTETIRHVITPQREQKKSEVVKKTSREVETQTLDSAADIEQKDQRLETIKKEHDQAIQRAEEKIKKSEDNLRDIVKQNAQMEEEVTQLQRQLSMLNTLSAESTEQLAAASAQEKKNLEDKIKELTQTLRENVEGIYKSQDEIQVLHKDYQKQLKELRAQLVKSEIETTKQVEDAQKQAQLDVEKAQADVGRVQTDLERIRSDLSRKEEELVAARVITKQHEQKIAELEELMVTRGVDQGPMKARIEEIARQLQEQEVRAGELTQRQNRNKEFNAKFAIGLNLNESNVLTVTPDQYATMVQNVPQHMRQKLQLLETLPEERLQKIGALYALRSILISQQEAIKDAEQKIRNSLLSDERVSALNSEKESLQTQLRLQYELTQAQKIRVRMDDDGSAATVAQDKKIEGLRSDLLKSMEQNANPVVMTSKTVKTQAQALNETKEQIDKYKNTIRRLQEESQDKDSIIERLKEVVGQQRDTDRTIAEQRARIDEEKVLNYRLQSALSSSEISHREALLAKEAQEQEIHNLKTKLKKTEDTKQTFEQKEWQLLNAIHEKDREYNDAIQQQKNKITDLENTVSSGENWVKRYKEVTDEQKHEIITLQQQMSERDTQMLALNEQIQTLTQQLESTEHIPDAEPESQNRSTGLLFRTFNEETGRFEMRPLQLQSSTSSAQSYDLSPSPDYDSRVGSPEESYVVPQQFPLSSHFLNFRGETPRSETPRAINIVETLQKTQEEERRKEEELLHYESNERPVSSISTESIDSELAAFGMSDTSGITKPRPFTRDELDLRTAFEKAQRANELLSARVVELEAHLQNNTNATNLLSDEAIARTNVLQAHTDSMSAINDELLAQTLNLQSQVYAQAQEIREKEGDIQSKTDALREKDEAIALIRLELEQGGAGNKALTERLEAALRERGEISDDLALATATSMILRKDLTRAENTLQSKNDELSALRASLSTTQGALNTQTAEANVLRSQLKTEQDQSAKALDKAREEITETKRQITELRAQILDARTGTKEAKTDVTRIGQELEQANLSVAKLTKDLEAKAQEIERITSEFKDVDKKKAESLERLTLEKEQLTVDIQSLGLLMEELRLGYQALHQEHQEALSAVTKLTEENAVNVAKIAAITKERDEAVAATLQMQQERDAALLRNEGLSTEAKVRAGEIAGLRDETALNAAALMLGHADGEHNNITQAEKLVRIQALTSTLDERTNALERLQQEKQALNENNSSQELQLQERTEQLQHLRNSAVMYEATIAEHRQTAELAQNASVELERALDEEKTRSNQLQTTIEIQHSEIETLRQAQSDSAATSATMSKSLEDAQNELSILRTEKDSLTKQQQNTAELERQIEQRTKELEILTQAQQEQQERNLTTERDLKAALENVDTLQTQYFQSQEAILGTEKDLLFTQVSLEIAKGAIARQEEELLSIEQKQKVALENIATLTKDNAALKKQLESKEEDDALGAMNLMFSQAEKDTEVAAREQRHQQEIAQEKQQIERLTEEIHALRNQNNTLTENHASERSALAQQFGTKLNALEAVYTSAVDAHIATLEDFTNTAKAQLESEQQKSHAFESNITSLAAELSAERQNREKLTAAIANKEVQIAELEGRKTNATEDLERKEQQLRQLRDEGEALHNQNVVANQKIKELTDQLTENTAQSEKTLAQERLKSQKLDDEIKQKLEVIRKLEEDRGLDGANILSLQSEITQSQKELLALQGEYRQSTERIQSLENALTKTQKELTTARKEIETQQEVIKQLEAESQRKDELLANLAIENSGFIVQMHSLQEAHDAELLKFREASLEAQQETIQANHQIFTEVIASMQEEHRRNIGNLDAGNRTQIAALEEQAGVTRMQLVAQQEALRGQKREWAAAIQHQSTESAQVLEKAQQKISELTDANANLIITQNLALAAAKSELSTTQIVSRQKDEAIAELQKQLEESRAHYEQKLAATSSLSQSTIEARQVTLDAATQENARLKFAIEERATQSARTIRERDEALTTKDREIFAAKSKAQELTRQLEQHKGGVLTEQAKRAVVEEKSETLYRELKAAQQLTEQQRQKFTEESALDAAALMFGRAEAERLSADLAKERQTREEAEDASEYYKEDATTIGRQNAELLQKLQQVDSRTQDDEQVIITLATQIEGANNSAKRTQHEHEQEVKKLTTQVAALKAQLQKAEEGAVIDRKSATIIPQNTQEKVARTDTKEKQRCQGADKTSQLRQKLRKAENTINALQAQQKHKVDASTQTQDTPDDDEEKKKRKQKSVNATPVAIPVAIPIEHLAPRVVAAVPIVVAAVPIAVAAVGGSQATAVSSNSTGKTYARALEEFENSKDPSFNCIGDIHDAQGQRIVTWVAPGADAKDPKNHVIYTYDKSGQLSIHCGENVECTLPPQPRAQNPPDIQNGGYDLIAVKKGSAE